MSCRILFQGDSITDAGRNREDFYDMGRGYADLVRITLEKEAPQQYECINRGVGGELLVDLYGRLETDFLALQPDYASVLIGTNDAWSDLDSGRPIATAAFAAMYVDMLERIRAACPQTRLLLMGPYVVEGGFSANTPEQPQRLAQFRAHIASRIEVIRRLAEDYRLPFVDLQAVFDTACQDAEPSYWTVDGIHPTPAGHAQIRDAWLSAFARL